MRLKTKILTTLAALAMAINGRAVEKLIIVNEGNWQSDNGKLSYFEDGKIVSNQWFREVNGSKLGDTPNDIIQINDDLIAIAINWSNIVQFITPQGKAVAATEDIPNNRKLASDGRYLYVTSYGHECNSIYGMMYFTKGYVAKIDISTFQVVAACEVGYEPEGIALYKGHLFIANTGGYAFQERHDYETTVSIVDAETMTKVRDVDTGQINLYGKMSRSGRYLCINSPGDYYNIMAATIIFDCDAALKGESDCFTKLDYASTYNCTTIDGNFYAIGSRYSYYTGEYSFNYLTIDPKKVMETHGAAGISASLPGTLLADIKAMTMPYGLYVNPYTGYIYATDAASFAGAGSLYQWSPNGVLIGKHKVYINPGHFLALPSGTTNGVTGVAGDSPLARDRYYNLSGVPVNRPVPGEIYIHNGKKELYR
jgi:DNA-binding beta-propeller fold protein YncE